MNSRAKRRVTFFERDMDNRIELLILEKIREARIQVDAKLYLGQRPYWWLRATRHNLTSSGEGLIG